MPRYKGSLNMNVLDTAGLISASFGALGGRRGRRGRRGGGRLISYRYMRLEFDGDHVVGALSLRPHGSHVGVLRGLIQTPVNAGTLESRSCMEDPNRIVEAYVARTG